MLVGVSAQTAVKTLSGWSGEIRGEIAVKLVLVAMPLRPRPDFETSRALCGLAQNSAHSELTPNFAAQAARTLLLSNQLFTTAASRAGQAKPSQAGRTTGSPSATASSAAVKYFRCTTTS
ncbi:hypothetical protein ACFQHW_09475 [Lapidilactobacillus achengensis]|uniref:Uncharacterized protein n=1 Tax=Lapidilactobacillus achengensis TaxID=2486000 RepID=A0ABW1UT30_9LACO|nr:hypothetical protein [Lapidilactobacillus achengensis]